MEGKKTEDLPAMPRCFPSGGGGDHSKNYVDELGVGAGAAGECT